MKKILGVLLIATIAVILTGCENGLSKDQIIDKYEGKYAFSYDENTDELDGLVFFSEIEMKKCESKNSENCLKLYGKDNQLTIMEREDDTYITIPVSFFVNEKESNTEGQEDIINARACFEWNEYDILNQIMCPPADSNNFEKEELDPDYYFRLIKDVEES